MIVIIICYRQNYFVSYPLFLNPKKQQQQQQQQNTFTNL